MLFDILNRMKVLIIGGSRGIGWELAKIYSLADDVVVVTGRKQPDQDSDKIEFEKLDLSTGKYIEDIESLVKKIGKIDRLVFAPGYYQEGTITDLEPPEILDMIQVCGTAFIFAVRSVLNNQNELDECIVITSSSQWTPRKLEPIYNFTKAGLGHFAHALSQDERVKKVLVAGPTGTKTAFHEGREVDMSTYHAPAWVAQQIHDYSEGKFNYKFIKILRDPAEVEVSTVE